MEETQDALWGRQVGQKTDGAVMQEGWHWKKREGEEGKSSAESAHAHLATGTEWQYLCISTGQCPSPEGLPCANTVLSQGAR